MSETLLRGLVWCKRFHRRCGYGVHSPSDFFFITSVIYEKLPFYTYSRLHHLRRLVANLSGHREKTDKFFFRLVNYLHPRTIIEFGTGSGMTTRYMSEADSTTDIYTFSDESYTQVKRLFASKKNVHYLNYNEFDTEKFVLSGHKPVLYRIAHTECYEEIYKKIIDNVSDVDCLVISYPYADKKKRQWWKNVVEDVRTGVTFDLYEIGIVFFNRKRIKENRTISFL